MFPPSSPPDNRLQNPRHCCLRFNSEGLHAMKRSLILLILSVPGLAGAAEAKTNRLAIYLAVEGPPREALLNGTARPGGLRLDPEPLLSDADFVAYDKTNHTFDVTPKTAERLVRRLLGPKGRTALAPREVEMYLFAGFDYRPFVLTASGKPIYVGAFSSNASSSFFPLVPTIMYSPRPSPRGKSAANVRLAIEWHGKDPGAPVAQRSHEDLRNDPSILAALQGLGL